MGTRYYIFISCVFLTLSFIILYYKNYFSVRHFTVNRSDIETYLNSQKTLFKNFFLVNDSAVNSVIALRFEDVESVEIYSKDYLTLQVGVKTKQKQALLKTDNNKYYIDYSGKLFKSSLSFEDKKMAIVNNYAILKSSKIFDAQSILLITNLSLYPNIVINIKEHYFKIASIDKPNLYIEVYKVGNGKEVATSINKDILSVSEAKTTYLVIDNKIVVKK